VGQIVAPVQVTAVVLRAVTMAAPKPDVVRMTGVWVNAVGNVYAAVPNKAFK